MITIEFAGYRASFNWQPWLRPVAFGAALLVAALMGPLQGFVSPKLLVIAMAAPLGLIGLTIVLSLPMAYLVLAIPAASNLLGGYLLPQKATVTLVLAIAVFGLWILRMLLIERRLHFVWANANVPLLGFVGVLAISLVWSNLFRDPLVFVWADFPLTQIVSGFMMFMLPVSFLLVLNFLRDIKWLKILWFIMIVGGGLYGLGILLNLPYVLYMGVEGIWPTWVVALAYTQVLYNERLKMWHKAALLALCAVMVYRFFFLGAAIAWVSGWAPLATSIGVITFIRSRKLTMLLLAVLLIFIYVKSDYLYEAIFVEAEEDGSYERFELWQRNIDLVSKHWLFGTGPAGYAVYYMTYNADDARSTHNNYFDILSQVGITGFLLYLWFFFAVGWIGLRLMIRLARRRDFAEGLAHAVLGTWPAVMLAMMLGDWIMPFAYNGTIAGYSHAVYTWMMFGALATLDQLTKPTSKTNLTNPVEPNFQLKSSL